MKTKLPLAWCVLLLCGGRISSPLNAADAPRAKEKATEKAPAVESKSVSIRNVDPNEFDRLRKEKNHVILDVRTPKEYAEGHIVGAVNLDFYADDFDKKIAALDKSKTYLVHCAAGVRSFKACQKMRQLEFPSLINLGGGMKAWEKAGKPTVK